MSSEKRRPRFRRNRQRREDRESFHSPQTVARRSVLYKDCGNVRFGSEADICSAKRHVRFTSKSGRSREKPLRVLIFFDPKKPDVYQRSNRFGVRQSAPVECEIFYFFVHAKRHTRDYGGVVPTTSPKLACCSCHSESLSKNQITNQKLIQMAAHTILSFSASVGGRPLTVIRRG